MPSIAAVLIVKNEAHHLPECLARLESLVDTVVVVDTGSSDESVRLASEQGAIVAHFPWTGRFDDARNHALEVAEAHGPFDFVLSVDADERVSCKLDPMTWREQLDPEKHICATVSFIAREGHAPYREYRLIASRPDLRWKNGIHETFMPDVHRLQREEGLSITHVPLQFLHLGYRTDIKARKYARDLELLQHALTTQPARTYIRTELARIHEVMGEDEEAEQRWFEGLELARQELYSAQLLRDAEPRDAIGLGGMETTQAAAFIGTLLHLQRRFQTIPEEHLCILEEALEFFPDNDLIAMIHMSHLGSTNRVEEALERGLRILEDPPGDRRGMKLSLFEKDLPHQCAEYAAISGQLELARELETDEHHETRIEFLKKFDNITASEQALSFAEGVEVSFLDETSLKLRKYNEKARVHGPTAFVVATLLEPCSPRDITEAFANAANKTRKEIEPLVARALRRLIYKGFIDLPGVKSAGSPRIDFTSLGRSEEARPLLFELPVLAHRRKDRLGEVRDFSRQHDLAPILWSREEVAPRDLDNLSRGLLEYGTREASELIASSKEALIVPAGALLPTVVPAPLRDGDVRLLPWRRTSPTEGLLTSQALEVAAQIRGDLLATLTEDARALDDVLDALFNPERRLKWESCAERDSFPPTETLRPAAGRTLCVVPHYRCEQWLGRTLHSIVTQTLPPDRIAVLCDGNERVAKQFFEEFPSVTFMLSREHVGPYALIQAAIEATTHEWIMIQDADDWSSTDRSMRTLDAARRTKARYLSTNTIQLFAETNLVAATCYARDGTARARRGAHAAAHAACMIHRSLIEECQGFATAHRFGADAEFASRAAWKSSVFVLPAATLFCQMREDSLAKSSETGLHSRTWRELDTRTRERARARSVQERSGQAITTTPPAVLVREAIALEHLAGPPLADKEGTS